MLYILAIFFPPLVLFIIGKPFQAIFNMFLCCLLWIPAMIHAFFAIHSYKKDERIERLIKAMSK